MARPTSPATFNFPVKNATLPSSLPLTMARKSVDAAVSVHWASTSSSLTAPGDCVRSTNQVPPSAPLKTNFVADGRSDRLPVEGYHQT